MTNRKDLPSPSAPNFSQRMRETMMTYLGKQGDPLDRGLTLRDLIESGIIKLKQGFGPGGSGSGALPLDPGSAVYVQDLTPPPAPTGFSASASIVNVLFETDAPKFRVGNGHLKTVIYGISYAEGDDLPTFADAVKVTEFPGNVSGHPLDPGSKWRYWATWVTRDGVEGQPAGGTNGIEATTDLIDSAKIISLSASQITAGTISVGDYIESSSYVPNTSGWRINGDGTAFLENAVVRGTVYATAGTFSGTVSGATINGSVINGSTINVTGSESGWGWMRSGTKWWFDSELGWILARDSASGDMFFEVKGANSHIRMGSGASTSGHCSISFPKFSVDQLGNATFGGVLTAEAVNAVNTINIAGQAVTVTESASHTITGNGNNVTTSGSNSYTFETYMAHGGELMVIAVCTAFSGSPATDVVEINLSIDGWHMQGFVGTDTLALGSHTLIGKKSVSSGWKNIQATTSWQNLEPMQNVVAAWRFIIHKAYR